MHYLCLYIKSISILNMLSKFAFETLNILLSSKNDKVLQEPFLSGEFSTNHKWLIRGMCLLV